MSIYAFNRDTLPLVPWKNGGGSTRELARWPLAAGLADFDWRVSIACVAQSGPFSVFEGMDRQIMLLEGSGFDLQACAQGAAPAFSHALDVPLASFAFRGEAAVQCRLRGSASNDFNVMTRRGLWRAEIEVFEQATTTVPCGQGLLLALSGQWLLSDANPANAGECAGEALCAAGEGLYWTEAPQAWQLTPETPQAKLVLVRFIQD